MTYYGARASRYYFHQLECCRRSSEPHDIVSVIGGMAWLHAIGPNTRGIILLDADKDAVDFCNKVIDAIWTFDTLVNFKEWVAANTPNRFTHLEGHGLESGMFYWHFGEYNLASQEHYAELKENMHRLKCISPIQYRLEEWDYTSQHSQFVFVSNADGSNGFNGDKILPRVIATATTRTTYVNWLHRITIEPNPYKRSYEDHRDL